MKRLLLSIFLIIVVLLGLLCAFYGPTFVYRVLVWQESDYDDGEKFPYSTISKGSEVFQFEKTDSHTEEAELSRLAIEVEEDDFKRFLEERGTYSFLIIRNDTILTEQYFNGSTRATLQNTFSVSKSILALAVLKALELGYIKDLEDSINDYVPYLGYRERDFAKISIGDLLRMKSGIKYSAETGFPWVNRDNVMTYYHPDLRYVAHEKTEINAAPDETFLYNNYNPLLIGVMMEKVTRRSISEFIEEHIWSEIGTQYDARWSTDNHAFEKMESGFMATPIDMAKIGRLLLHNGRYKDTQVLDEELLISFTEPITEIKVYEDRIWGYGHFWWSLPDESDQPSIMANGHMGQFIFINPKTNYVIIRNGLQVGKFYDDDWTEIFKAFTKE